MKTDIHERIQYLLYKYEMPQKHELTYYGETAVVDEFASEAYL